MSKAEVGRLLSGSFVQYQGFLEESQSPPLWQVAGGLLMSPSTGEAGTSCHRMAKENSRTLSTACRSAERGAAVMEDLGIGSRQWQTLWNHHPQPALHPSAWKTFLQEWSVKENVKRSNSSGLKQREEKRKRESQTEDGKDQVLS